jgi:hypothetical protein
MSMALEKRVLADQVGVGGHAPAVVGAELVIEPTFPPNAMRSLQNRPTLRDQRITELTSPMSSLNNLRLPGRDQAVTRVTQRSGFRLDPTLKYEVRSCNPRCESFSRGRSFRSREGPLDKANNKLGFVRQRGCRQRPPLGFLRPCGPLPKLRAEARSPHSEGIGDPDCPIVRGTRRKDTPE